MKRKDSLQNAFHTVDSDFKLLEREESKMTQTFLTWEVA